jgi:hypothetical protein
MTIAIVAKKILDDQLFCRPVWIGEFQRTVSDISRAGDLRADVMAQVARKMQKQVANGVPVRIRPKP